MTVVLSGVCDKLKALTRPQREASRGLRASQSSQFFNDFGHLMLPPRPL
jgi:hypothetical protein